MMEVSREERMVESVEAGTRDDEKGVEVAVRSAPSS